MTAGGGKMRGLEARQAEMRARWQRRNYKLPVVKNKRIVIQPPTSKRTGRTYGGVPAIVVNELRDLAHFVRLECSPDVRHILEIMAGVTHSTSKNDVVINLCQLFVETLKAEAR